MPPTTAPADATPVAEPLAAPAAADVIAALAWVTANMGGIMKRRRPREQADDREFYAYRGIDEIASQAQPLLGLAGVVIVPTEGTITSIEPITIRGNPWTDTLVTVCWTIYGPGNTMIESRTQGVGRDNSDKGYNKAMTQAYKNLLLRLLCIGDPKDDADSQEHQGNATDPKPPAAPQEDEERKYAREVFESVRALANTPGGILFAEWRKTNPGSLKVSDLAADSEWAMAVEAAAKAAADGTLEVPPPEPPAAEAPAESATDTPPDAPLAAPAPEVAQAAADATDPPAGRAKLGARASRQSILEQAKAEGIDLNLRDLEASTEPFPDALPGDTPYG